MAEHVAYMGELRNACSNLIGKPEGKRTLRRPRCRWKDKPSLDIKEIVWGSVDWIIWLSVGTSGGLLWTL